MADNVSDTSSRSSEDILFPLFFSVERVRKGYIKTSYDEGSVAKTKGYYKVAVTESDIDRLVGEEFNLDKLAAQIPVVYRVEVISETEAQSAASVPLDDLAKAKLLYLNFKTRKESGDIIWCLKVTDTGTFEFFGNAAEKVAAGIGRNLDSIARIGGVPFISFKNNREAMKQVARAVPRFQYIEVSERDIIEWSRDHAEEKLPPGQPQNRHREPPASVRPTGDSISPMFFYIERIRKGYVLVVYDEGGATSAAGYYKELVLESDIYRRIGELLHLDRLAPEKPVMYRIETINNKSLKDVRLFKKDFSVPLDYLTLAKLHYLHFTIKDESKGRTCSLKVTDTGFYEFFGKDAEQLAVCTGGNRDSIPKIGGMAFLTIKDEQYLNQVAPSLPGFKFIEVSEHDVVEWFRQHAAETVFTEQPQNRNSGKDNKDSKDSKDKDKK